MEKREKEPEELLDDFKERLVSLWYSFRCDPITMNFRARMEESRTHGFAQFHSDTRREFLKRGINSASMGNFNYEDGQAQEYSVPWVARQYMIRYAMAYAFEYYVMYALALGWLKDDAKIYSFGCGTGFDCLSLLYAKKILNYPYDVQYRGTDIAEWSEDCKFDPAEWIPGSKIYYGKKDGNMVNFLNHGEDYVPNILLFPKMLSEVTYEPDNPDDDVLGKFCDKLEGLKQEKLVLCISYRSRYSLDKDSRAAASDLSAVYSITKKLNSLGYRKLTYKSAEDFFGNNCGLPEIIRNGLEFYDRHFVFRSSVWENRFGDTYDKYEEIGWYDSNFKIPNSIWEDVGFPGEVGRICPHKKEEGIDLCTKKVCIYYESCPHSAVKNTGNICFDIIPFTKK